jgi:hypothetical protein
MSKGVLEHGKYKLHEPANRTTRKIKSFRRAISKRNGVLEMLQQYEALLLPDELMLIYELEAINGAA